MDERYTLLCINLAKLIYNDEFIKTYVFSNFKCDSFNLNL